MMGSFGGCNCCLNVAVMHCCIMQSMAAAKLLSRLPSHAGSCSMASAGLQRFTWPSP
ncbi:hypothetical protein Dimus_001533 [Dionaea muscipula]